MNKKTYSAILSLSFLIVPSVAFAAKDFKWLVGFIIDSFVEPLTYLIMSLAIVFFLWNMAMAVKNSDNPEELTKFKDKAVWGIVAIAVMVSMWGLVAFVTRSVDLDTNEEIIIPGLPGAQ